MLRPLVDADGIDDVGRHSRLPRQRLRKKRAEIRSVLAALGQRNSSSMSVVHQIGAAGDRRQQTAASDNRVQLANVVSRFFERGLNLLGAKLLLLQNRAAAERIELGVGVPDVLDQRRRLVR